MTAPASVLDRAWELAPQVSVRPERFGALLYHFGTRRLSFLKDRRLLAVVEALATAPTARQACLDAGVPDESLPAYDRALARLAETDMIRPREPSAARHEHHHPHRHGHLARRPLRRRARRPHLPDVGADLRLQPGVQRTACPARAGATRAS